MNKQKINQIVGSIGAFIGIIVFIAYIPQIIANLQGHKAQPFQPLSQLSTVAFGSTTDSSKKNAISHLLQPMLQGLSLV